MAWTEITTSQNPDWLIIVTDNPFDNQVYNRQGFIILTRSGDYVITRSIPQDPNWAPVDDSQA